MAKRNKVFLFFTMLLLFLFTLSGLLCDSMIQEDTVAFYNGLHKIPKDAETGHIRGSLGHLKWNQRVNPKKTEEHGIKAVREGLSVAWLNSPKEKLKITDTSIYLPIRSTEKVTVEMRN